MSFLKKVAHGIAGFATGGVGGAIQAFAAPGNPRKTKNVGRDPSVNTTKGKVQLNPDLSPVPMSGVPMQAPIIGNVLSSPPSTGAFSASGLVRNAFSAAPAASGFPTMQATPALYTPGGGNFGGGGAAIQSYAPGMSPSAMYHRFVTKKGTLRRIKRNGEPYKAPRMNPMNPRAARRAIRRIRGARKLLQRIERSLPKARSAPRSRARSSGRHTEIIHN